MIETNLQPLEPRAVEFQDWGLIPYQVALNRQIETLEQVASGERPDTIVLCTHPPVVTLGRSTESGDVTSWTGETIEVSRGGRATYHGPDQLVIYPILNLETRGRDLHRHLRWMEDWVIRVLATYGVKAQRESGATGVWVGEKKICSLGVAVKKWVSFHGLSLAVDKSESAYQGINPCGFSSSVMTNLEALVGAPIDRRDLQQRFIASYQ